MTKRPKVPRHEDWRGKPIKTVIKREPAAPDPGTEPNPNLKFSCECGFSSTVGPDHKCTKDAWPPWHVESR